MSCQDLEKNFQYCPASCYLFCEGCNHCEQESPSMECEYCGPVGEPCKDCYICISPFACLFVDILWCPGRLGCYVSKKYCCPQFCDKHFNDWCQKCCCNPQER